MTVRVLIPAFALLACLNAQAGCSRAIHVPVAPIGLSVVVNGTAVSGVFPDMLRAVGAQAGCEFRMTPVPRARVEVMFEQGSADMLVAATHSDRRDRSGDFIPLLQTRPMLLSLPSARAPIRSLDEFVAASGLKLAVVRGFDYGPAYLAALEQLRAHGRVSFEKDPLEIARLLKAGIVDATIMPASALYGAALNDTRVRDIAATIRAEPLEGLPWSYGGVYLSRRSLSAADRQLLTAVLKEKGTSKRLYQAYRDHYPPELVALGTRPL